MNRFDEVPEITAILRVIFGEEERPGMGQIVHCLGKSIGLGATALWPLALSSPHAKTTLAANFERYRAALAPIAAEQLLEVPSEVAVPLLERFAYVGNPQLSAMYVELLSKASQREQAHLAHPSFVNLIGNLSPDEATLLKSIRRMPGIPYVEARAMNRERSEWSTLNEMIPGVPCLDDLSYPQNIAAYISNLEGLGVLQNRPDIYMVGENIYEPLERDGRERYQGVVASNDDRVLEFRRGQVNITSFGRLMLTACFAPLG